MQAILLRIYVTGGPFARFVKAPERHFDLQGLYLTTGSQHMDNFINIDHAAPGGKSNLLYKGILDDNSSDDSSDDGNIIDQDEYNSADDE